MTCFGNPHNHDTAVSCQDAELIERIVDHFARYRLGGRGVTREEVTKIVIRYNEEQRARGQNYGHDKRKWSHLVGSASIHYAATPDHPKLCAILGHMSATNNPEMVTCEECRRRLRRSVPSDDL